MQSTVKYINCRVIKCKGMGVQWFWLVDSKRKVWITTSAPRRSYVVRRRTRIGFNSSAVARTRVTSQSHVSSTERNPWAGCIVIQMVFQKRPTSTKVMWEVLQVRKGQGNRIRSGWQSSWSRKWNSCWQRKLPRFQRIESDVGQGAIIF